MPDGLISPGKQIVAPGKEARQDKFKRPLGYIVGLTKSSHLERTFVGLMRGNREGNKALRKNFSSGNLSSGSPTVSPRDRKSPRSPATSPRNEKVVSPREKKAKPSRLNSKSDADESDSEEFSDYEDDEFVEKRGLPSSKNSQTSLLSASTGATPSPSSLNKSGVLSKSGRERPYLDGLSASSRARYVQDLGEKPDPVDRTALFIPTDTRDPRFIIAIDELPADWVTGFRSYADTVFEVKVDYWHEKISFPYGKEVKVSANQTKPQLQQTSLI
jgi:hypothetical protein